MSIIIGNISLPLDAPEQEAHRAALKLIGLYASRVKSIYTAKISVDARRKNDIRLVYSVGVDLDWDEEEFARSLQDPRVMVKRKTAMGFTTGAERIDSRPVIVGLGPCGMFAALTLARLGFRPIIIERGYDIDRRAQAVSRFWETGELDTECNVQFGAGGAGAFSDGKLTTRISDARCDFVLEELVKHGAPPDIMIKAKPHIGTDRLRTVVRSVCAELESLGAQLMFGTRLDGILTDARGVRGIRTSAGEIGTRALLMCIGNSARDTFEMLYKAQIYMESKPFSVGVRIEHLQSDIEKALYGDMAGHPSLPRGEYQLSYREGERAVYTFCMCPGGFVVPAASEEGCVVINGMSEYARGASNANSALAVSVDKYDFGHGVLDGMYFQRSLERHAFLAGGGRFKAPAQTVGSFIEGGSALDIGRVKPSYALGVQPCDLGSLLPPYITEILKKGITVFNSRINGFAAADAVLSGVETRTSSPVRILRGDSLESPGIPGLYPCGEGAGYAGGIMSAAVDGIRAAQAFAARYSPSGL